MASDNVLTFNDDNFEADVLNSDLPVLVDFWAEWCGPCQMLTPVIEELAKEYTDKIKVGKVDVDQARGTATQFGIQNIPTVLLFQGGKQIESFVGVRKKGDYKTALNAVLGVS